MTGARGYDLTALKRVLLNGNSEILVRGFVILAATVGVLVIAGQIVVGLWTLSYMAWSIIYNLVLRRLPDRLQSAGLAAVIALEATVTLHWPVLFVYLWSLGDVAFKCIAMLIIAAAMTNAMGARSEERILRTSDTLSSSILLALMTWLLWRDGHPTSEVFIVAVVSALMMIWLFTSLGEVSSMRRRLAQAERAAFERQRIEAIGRLTGGVAHDFNNILTVIGGNLDLANEVSDGTERAALLAEARRATDRAAGVTSQLLAYSRQSVLAPQDVEVCAAMERVKGFLTRLLPETIQLHFVNDLPVQQLRLDRTRFESALINLILNARDAISGHGRIEVTARLCPRIEATVDRPAALPVGAGPFVCIEVWDNGAGIAPDILPKVVEPYFTTKPVGQGSGLGLSMAKGFAEQSGGALHITSEPGIGTVVQMYFPSPAAAALMAAQ